MQLAGLSGCCRGSRDLNPQVFPGTDVVQLGQRTRVYPRKPHPVGLMGTGGLQGRKLDVSAGV